MSESIPAVAELKHTAINQLAAAGVPSPESDVDQLLMQVLELDRTGLLTAQNLVADENQYQQFQELIQRRANREPLQHLLGKAYFRHLELAVGPGVFVPRPETEVLVDLALQSLPQALAQAPTTPLGSVPTTLVDLCSGSGAIALALATELNLDTPDLTRPVTLCAVELDEAAIEWTRRNAEQTAAQLPGEISVKVVQADARTAATEELARLRGQVSVVTCNPPYIPAAAIPRDPEVRDYDPAIALYGGPDGLEIVREIVQTAADLLYPGGVLLIEHGDQQGESDGALGVPRVVQDHGAFTAIQDHLDLTGRPRVTVAIKN